MKKLLIATIIATLGIISYQFYQKPTVDGSYVVKIGYFKTVTNDLPMFIADELGWLKEDGISYELVPMTTSNHALEAVASGRIDLYTMASIMPIFSAEAVSPNKIKLFNVGVLKKDNPFDVLLSLKSSDISLWKGLEGKKIGVYPGSTATKMLHNVFTKKNVDMSKVELVPLPPQNHILALLNGSIDLLHAFEPTTSALYETGKVKEIYGSLYAEILGGSTPIGGGAVSVNFIKEHPEKIDTIIKNIKKGYEFMHNNSVEARSIMEKRLDLTPFVAQRINIILGSLGDDINIKNTQNFANFLYEIGELPAFVNVESMLYKGN